MFCEVGGVVVWQCGVVLLASIWSCRLLIDEVKTNLGYGLHGAGLAQMLKARYM